MNETCGIKVPVHLADAVGEELEQGLEVAESGRWEPYLVAGCCDVGHGVLQL